MKIDQILTEEITYADVAYKFSGNNTLLQFIIKAGTHPKNNTDGKTDWGSAVDMGSADYQAHLANQSAKQASKSAMDRAKDDSIKRDTDDSDKGWSSKFRGNQYTGGIPGNAQNQVPLLKDLPTVDTSTIGKSATTSYSLGKGLASVAGTQVKYAPRMKMAASKKNTGKKL